MSEFKIATFGCWNMGCTKYSGQESVKDLLKSKQSEYDFMVILGDNYYANKVKIDLGDNNDFKIKQNKLIEAKNGFACLDEINLEKKLIMGNHDLDDNFDKDCSILINQLKLQWYDVKFPYGFDFYYLVSEDKKVYSCVLMIYLDTTIYDPKIKELGGKYCIKKTLGKNVDDLVSEQNQFIINTLEFINNPIFNIKNVVFYGHQPLIYTKEKVECDYVMKTIDPLLNLLFDEKNKYQTTNFYWVCADYNVYLNTNIN